MTDEPALAAAVGTGRGVDLDAQPFVLITGMSGAGRTTTANVLEDLGWYVVDNLPPQMLGQLAQLRRDIAAQQAGTPLHFAAIVDVRARWVHTRVMETLAELRTGPDRPALVFLDSTDEALVRRFESVRRPHPLQGSGGLLSAIQEERAVMSDLRSEADVLIDTSGFNVHQLGAKISSVFAASAAGQVRLAVMSFGFKYGVPLDADFVLDMRFLPNPFWVPELRSLTGRDRPVADFVFERPGAAEFCERVAAMMDVAVEGYLREGRRYVTLAVGCTGGKHRSVAVAESLASRLRGPHVDTLLIHRDLGIE